MTNTSLPESNSSISISDNRYPRPLLVRIFRWLVIHWWPLPLIVLTIYLLPSLYFHALVNNLLFLVQHWWIIILLIVVLLVAGIAIRISYLWSDHDFMNEESELRRRRSSEAEREGYPPGFHLRHTLQGQNEILGIAWSPDGRTLATGSLDGTIRLWDADLGKEQRTLQGHTGGVFNVAWLPERRAVNSVAWSPDGHILSSGSRDGTIRLWDADLGQQKGIIEGHTSDITSLSFSFDGRFLASNATDDTVRLWRTDRWEVIAVLNLTLPRINDGGFFLHPARLLVFLLERRVEAVCPEALCGCPPVPDCPPVRHAFSKIFRAAL